MSEIRKSDTGLATARIQNLEQAPGLVAGCSTPHDDGNREETGSGGPGIPQPGALHRTTTKNQEEQEVELNG